MPSPGAQDSDRHGVFVVLRKALCSGHIEIEGEFPVAHGHHSIGIDRVNYDVMPGDQSVAIDPLSSAGELHQSAGGNNLTMNSFISKKSDAARSE